MPDPIVFPALFGGAVTLIAFVSALTNAERRRRRRLKKAPRRDIRHLPDKQLARYTGRVLGHRQPLEAPLSGRACVCWRVVITERSGKSTRTLLDKQAGQDFTISDGTGKMLVRFEGAELALVLDGKYASGLGHDAAPALERFLAAHGEKSTGWVFNRDLTYREAALEPGEAVAVAGVAHAEPDPDPDPSLVLGPRETAMHMVLDPAPKQPIIISDDPRLAHADDD